MDEGKGLLSVCNQAVANGIWAMRSSDRHKQPVFLFT